MKTNAELVRELMDYPQSVIAHDYYYPRIKIIEFLGYEWQGRVTIYKVEIYANNCLIGTSIMRSYKLPPSIIKVDNDGFLLPPYNHSRNWKWIIRNYYY